MKRTALGMMLAVGVLLGLGANSFAVYYVDSVDGNDANAGNGWGSGSAWKTVTNALTQAVAPSEIWVKAGTYYPTTDSDRSKSITMKAGVDLYGGFAGTESSRGERNWSNSVTILSGDIGTPSDPADNSYHVVVGATARIDGFVIRDGRADDASLGYNSSRGGGMYTVGAFPITANCTFSNNQAGSGNYSGGGGVFWYQETYTPGTVGWYNCTFDANVAYAPSASAYAGALDAYFMTNVFGAISNCVFKNNVATGGTTSVSAMYLLDIGQKVWPEGAAFEVVDCLFSNNTDYIAGPGAVHVEQFVAPVVFRDCQFVANSNSVGNGTLRITVDPLGQGLQMTGCVFDGNYTGNTLYGGGAIYITYSGTNSYWRNCVFRNNVANGWGGGAIYGTLDGTFDTCTFISNSAPHGAGGVMYVGGIGKVTNDVFTNCTFTANTAASSGGAVYIEVPETFKNCTFTENVMGPGGQGGALRQGAGVAGLTSLISQCTFTSNGRFDGDNWVNGGGAIGQGNSDMMITGCVFTQNKSLSYGGAIYIVGFSAINTILDCTFTSNRTVNGGGGAVTIRYGTANMRRNVLISNNTDAYGGGIYLESTATTSLFANCVFRDNNAAAAGGAIGSYDAAIIVSNVTAYTNICQTGGNGGAIYKNTTATYTCQVVNCIFWNNFPIEIQGNAGGMGVTYSCIRGGYTGTGNISVDPLFADSIYAHEQSKNGYYDGGYFTGGTWLTAANNSPAIDAGDPASDFSLEPVANGSRINMGAYGDTELASKSRMVYSGTILQIK